MNPSKKSLPEKAKSFKKQYEKLLSIIKSLYKTIDEESEANKNLVKHIKKCNTEVKRQREKLKLVKSLRYQAIMNRTLQKSLK